MLATDIPDRFNIPFARAAAGGFITYPIPEPSQQGIQDGRASLTDGFPPLNFIVPGAGGVPPFGADFNGLMKQVTLWNQWQATGALSTYNGAFSTAVGGYPKGSLLRSVTYPGITWVSLIDNNIADPDITQFDTVPIWRPLPGEYPAAAVSAGLTYTLTQAAGQTLLRSNSGNAMIDTLPGTSPGVLPAGTMIRMTNAETAALLAIQVGAGAVLRGWRRPYLILGPGQTASIVSDGTNYWAVNVPNRTLIGANTQLFVTIAGGDSTGMGVTTGTAFRNFQAAHDLVFQTFDLNGYQMKLKASAGGYVNPLVIDGKNVGQGAVEDYVIEGNTAAPNTYQIAVGQPAISVRAGGQVTIQGFLIQSIGSNMSVQDGGSSLYYGNMEFAGALGPSADHVVAGPYGRARAIANNLITAAGERHVNASQGQVQVLGGVVETFSSVAAQTYVIFGIAIEGGLLNYGGTIVVTPGTVINGQRYGASFNGVIYTGTSNVNYFPGTTPGITVAGGQYG